MRELFSDLVFLQNLSVGAEYANALVNASWLLSVANGNTPGEVAEIEDTISPPEDMVLKETESELPIVDFIFGDRIGAGD